MSSLQKVAGLLLLVTVVVAFGGWSPGRIEIAYDNEANTPLVKVGYPSNNTGFGVKFNPWSVLDQPNDQWVQLCTAKVRLCPPPIDGNYECKIRIHSDASGSPGSLLWESSPFDVMIGEWWHTIPITKPGGLWIHRTEVPQVYVFCVAWNGYNCLYQFFDGTKNAPAGTQWWFNGSTFSLVNNPNVGDAMIRLVIQKHDISAVGFVAPQDGDFYPECVYKNRTGFLESNVPLHMWIKTFPGGVPVYEDQKTVNFPAEEFPANRSVFFRFVHLDEGEYTAYVESEYHLSSGDGYPVRYDRNTINDLFVGNFALVNNKKGTAPAPKARTE